MIGYCRKHGASCFRVALGVELTPTTLSSVPLPERTPLAVGGRVDEGVGVGVVEGRAVCLPC